MTFDTPEQLKDATAQRRNTGDEAVEAVGRIVVDAAFKVHSVLGPGLLESVYEQCFAHELHKRSLRFELQKAVPIVYDGVRIDCALKLDLLVEDSVIVEIKAVEAILPVHKAQVLSYLKLANKPLGLLINFNVAAIREGIKRVIK
jgi:GxxExxY protein